MNALSNLHPQREMEGCFYHLCANIQKWKLYIILLLYRNINKAWCCWCVIAKSQLVVPPQNVSDEFDALAVPIRNVKKMQQIICWGILKIHTQDEIKEMFRAGHLFLTSPCGTYTTELTTCIQELPTKSQHGTKVFKGMFFSSYDI